MDLEIRQGAVAVAGGDAGPEEDGAFGFRLVAGTAAGRGARFRFDLDPARVKAARAFLASLVLHLIRPRSVQVSAKLLELVGPAQLGHGRLFDLADPLAGQVEAVADLLERQRPVVVQAEA